MLGVTYGVGIFINFVIAHVYGMQVMLYNPWNANAFQGYLMMPYTKVPDVVTGVAFAFIFSNVSDLTKVELDKKNKIMVFVACILAWCVMVIAFLMQRSASLWPTDWEPFNAYVIAFFRPIFVISIGFLALPYFFGYLHEPLTWIS